MRSSTKVSMQIMHLMILSAIMTMFLRMSRIPPVQGRIIDEFVNANYKANNQISRFSKIPTVLLHRLKPPQISSSLEGRRLALPKFKEAPAFRNGKECPAMTTQARESHQGFCDEAAVHIAMTLDSFYLRGVVAAVLSILQHSACPENFVFHFVASSPNDELQATLSSTFPYLTFDIHDFDDSVVRNKISTSIRKALDQPLNYARIYLADLLPSCVNRVIYLDSDLILVDDIAKLWRTPLGQHVLAAPEYCHANFTAYFTDNFWSDPNLKNTFEGRRACYFNTGVMVIDLVRWREGKYTSQIEEWMELHKERRLYNLGSLPPFLLVFAGQVQPVDHRWNQHGLGGDNFEGRCRNLHPGPVSLLHWSGKGKPWNRLDSDTPCPLDALWAPYDLLQKNAGYFED